MIAINAATQIHMTTELGLLQSPAHGKPHIELHAPATRSAVTPDSVGAPSTTAFRSERQLLVRT